MRALRLTFAMTKASVRWHRAPRCRTMSLLCDTGWRSVRRETGPGKGVTLNPNGEDADKGPGVKIGIAGGGKRDLTGAHSPWVLVERG